MGLIRLVVSVDVSVGQKKPVRDWFVLTNRKFAGKYLDRFVENYPDMLRSWLSDRHAVRELEEQRFCTMFKVPECFRLDPMTDACCVIISEADLQPSYINRIRRETDGQLLSRINAGVQLAAVWTNEMQNAGQNRQRTIIEELIGLLDSLQIRINEFMYRLNARKENHNGMEQ